MENKNGQWLSIAVPSFIFRQSFINNLGRVVIQNMTSDVFWCLIPLTGNIPRHKVVLKVLQKTIVFSRNLLNRLYSFDLTAVSVFFWFFQRTEEILILAKFKKPDFHVVDVDCPENKISPPRRKFQRFSNQNVCCKLSMQFQFQN